MGQVCEIPGQPFSYIFITSDIMNISFGPGQYLPSPLICKQVSALEVQSDDTAMADIGTHNEEFMDWLMSHEAMQEILLAGMSG